MEYQIRRQTILYEYGTMEADSHEQVVAMLAADLWGDSVQTTRDSRATISYEVNGVPVKGDRSL